MIKTLAIAGVGLIGGSIGLAARANGLADRIIGVGRSEERLQKAVDVGAINSYSLDLNEAASISDVLYLATPVATIISQLHSLSSLHNDLIVTDGGSSKTEIVSAAAHLPPSVRFVGGHPMAGSEEGGVEAASDNLYKDASYVITPTDTTDAEALNIVKDFAESLGSKVIVLSPERHDALVAASSHLPHIAAGAFLRVASRAGDDLAKVTAGSFRDLTRIADSSPVLWRDVCLTNRQPILDKIDDYTVALQEFRKLLETSDSDGLEAWFAGSRAIRSEIQEKKGKLK